MMQNVVEYQVSSMKDHPHIKKIEVAADRLLQVIYYPKVSLSILRISSRIMPSYSTGSK